MKIGRCGGEDGDIIVELNVLAVKSVHVVTVAEVKYVAFQNSL